MEQTFEFDQTMLISIAAFLVVMLILLTTNALQYVQNFFGVGFNVKDLLKRMETAETIAQEEKAKRMQLESLFVDTKRTYSERLTTIKKDSETIKDRMYEYQQKQASMEIAINTLTLKEANIERAVTKLETLAEQGAANTAELQNIVSALNVTINHLDNTLKSLMKN